MKIASRDLTRDEYFAEAERMYGKLARNWKLQCPICGVIYSLEQCGQERASDGLQMCIGRVTGKGGTAFGKERPNENGCDFAAFGLFQSPWRVYEKEIGVGEPTPVMPLAQLETVQESASA